LELTFEAQELARQPICLDRQCRSLARQAKPLARQARKLACQAKSLVRHVQGLAHESLELARHASALGAAPRLDVRLYRPRAHPAHRECETPIPFATSSH